MSIRRDGYFHGRVEWQVVDIATGRAVFKSRVYQRSTVNLGELCAIISSLKHLHGRGDKTTPVYSDSQVALSWFRQRTHRSKMPGDQHTKDAIDAVESALAWLIENNPQNPVLKWNTGAWGETPADYNRK